MNFKESVFGKRARFRGMNFHGAGRRGFFKAKFIGTVNFCGTDFGGRVDFKQAEFHAESWFADAKFRRGVSFFRAYFEKRVEFERVRFDGPARRVVIDDAWAGRTTPVIRFCLADDVRAGVDGRAVRLTAGDWEVEVVSGDVDARVEPAWCCPRACDLRPTTRVDFRARERTGRSQTVITW